MTCITFPQVFTLFLVYLLPDSILSQSPILHLRLFIIAIIILTAYMLDSEYYWKDGIVCLDYFPHHNSQFHPIFLQTT
jgi:hypothetical protein